MDQNNVDKLFQEKLEDFSPMPDEQVWKRIEASLNNRKKKRVIPIWWGIGTAAAILIFAVLLFNPFKVNEELRQNPVTTTELDIENQDSDVKPTTEQQNPTVEIDNAEQLTEAEDNAKFHEENEDSKSENRSLAPNKGHFKVDNTNHIATASVEGKKTDEERGQEQENPIGPTELDFGQKSNPSNTDNAVAVLDREKAQEKAQENQATEAIAIAEEASSKKSIYEAVEAQLKDDDQTDIAQVVPGKWTISPSVAPVYFNSIGQGSPIHSNFSENGKSGKVNLSYGISVAYDLGKKLKVRSGVHRVNMGYGTEDILFTSSLEGSINGMIDNIDYNSTSRSLVVESRKSQSVGNFSENATANQELLANANPALNGSMVQQLGYFEVPFELNYALVDKKFGVTLIGGLSSLFLVDNAVSLESQDGLVTEIGEANNVNSVNFSTNVGFGLNYQFTEKIQLNVEPIFKYQLNTFSESAGNFNPYSVGVYSGLSFKF